MLGTYASALFLIAVSVPLGAAILALCGARRFSWVSAAVGLAAATVLAWLLVRLPGEGLTTLLALAALALAALAVALSRSEGFADGLREGAPAALLALGVVSLPFIAEGQFGVLGTGFNVDMSQHLFAAEWMARPLGPAPDLVQQGYPVGPHALAVAGSELADGNLVNAFSGTTIAVPVLGALTALAGLGRLPRVRAIVAALLVAVPYLVASYLAQGSFKELYLAVFIVGFALYLAELEERRWRGPLIAVPGAILGAGALYAYSGPGIAWLAGTAGLWAAVELWRRRSRAGRLIRGAAPAVIVGLLALALAAGPEASRIADFGTNASTVADASDPEPPASRGAGRAGEGGAAGDAGSAGGGQGSATVRADRTGGDGLDLFNDDLGNLFGQITPLEAFGVWPSGDFRVEPGDGAVPAIAFYLGALLGAAALAAGLAGAWRRREVALPAALVTAVAIWLAARAISTPYATAKALQMIAPLATLIAVRELFAPEPLPRLRARRPLARLAVPVLAIGFAAAAFASSALALVNAPVGPERYSAGIGKLRERLTGEPLLLLAPSGQLAERHGAAFYGWELRGGSPICVEPFPERGGFEQAPPEGIRFVITIGGKKEAPFEALEQVSRRRRVALWEAVGFDPASAPAIPIDPAVPTDCELGLD